MVLPVVSPPIPEGAVAVRDGIITDVGTAEQLVADGSGAQVVEHRGVLTPGLVNAHTHLQYTSFAAVGSTPYEDYTAWSIAFNEEYARQADGDWVRSAEQGVARSLAAGVTCVSDIVTNFEARDVLLDAGLPGVAFLELIAVDADQWTGSVGDELREAVATAPTSEVTSVGISPHAPYSLDESVLRAMAHLARELGVRLHIHVAESDGEEEYFRCGSGTLADRLRVVSRRPMPILEQGGTGLSTSEFVEQLGLLGPDVHLAHGVYLGQDGRRRVAEHGSVVALCPRSNHVVGVDYPPVAAFLREGVAFGVGTDSLSSSTSLDPLEDLAVLADLAFAGGYDAPDVFDRLLHAATLGGAGALGLADRLGSLQPGKRADLAVFYLPGVAAADAVTQIVRSGAGTCAATVVAGELRWPTHPAD
ncbi:amidohydrolase family protein [Euzebya tangerina]|uniref:amidohydrolase family protein n=1 Tax=Euzebya tangerina TaxID=591198 RepID=UPI0013C2CE3E|nr:amidohydrolase family protein [Euzebya tangerina]